MNCPTRLVLQMAPFLVATPIAGMLAGLFSTLIYIFWFKGWFFLKGTAMAPDDAAHWFMGISPGSFGAVGALINFAVAYVVSRLTAPPPDHITDMVENIRVPFGAGDAIDH